MYPPEWLNTSWDIYTEKFMEQLRKMYSMESCKQLNSKEYTTGKKSQVTE